MFVSIKAKLIKYTQLAATMIFHIFSFASNTCLELQGVLQEFDTSINQGTHFQKNNLLYEIIFFNLSNGLKTQLSMNLMPNLYVIIHKITVKIVESQGLTTCHIYFHSNHTGSLSYKINLVFKWII